MSRPAILRALRRAHFLKECAREHLENLAGALPVVSYAAGADILTQGSRADALVLILEGRAELVRREKSGETRVVGRLVEGDVLGHVELFRALPHYATLRAVEPTRLLRWERRPLADFLRRVPAARSRLKFAAESLHLARQITFSWLLEGEILHGLVRRHPIVLVQALLGPGLVLAAAVWLFLGAAGWLGWLAGGLGLFSLGWAAWGWFDWRNDYYLVTDRRAVWVEKVIGIYDSRQEAPLRMVLSVSVRTTLLGRWLGYGDVIIRTYTGQITFRSLGGPQAMADLVEEHWHRLQGQDEQQDQQEMARALRQRLALEGIAPEPEPTETPPPRAGGPHPEPAPHRQGLDHWTFQMRFQQGDVITYRKHWAVLLRAIGLPSAAILLVGGVLGAHIGGAMQLVSPGTAWAGALLALVPLGLWWLYRYVDWANDIYQVTPTHIVDVTKKPLGREVRKVAPLENILGTEVDRRGIIGLMLNFGDVVANVGTAEFLFQGIYDPSGAQQDILRAQEAFLQRRKEAERAQRRTEMVEWISAYHDQVSERPPHRPKGDRR